jgi:hypothetical protein
LEVLIIIAIVATLATALFAYSSNSILSASIKEDSKQIEFLARSGIECAVKVWDSDPAKITKKFTSYPIYFKSDGSLRGSDQDTITYDEGEIGHCIITVNPDLQPDEIPPDVPSDVAEELVLFTSTAFMNNQSVSKKVYMIERMSGVVDASKWYDDNGNIIEDRLHNSGYTVESVSQILKRTDGTLFWGSCDNNEDPCTLDHILLFEKPLNSNFLNIKPNQKCMFIGRTIYFNMGINFSDTSGKNIGIVTFSGADIIITGDINLVVNETGNGSVSTVILKTHPQIEQYLYTVNGKKMGKVYFMGDVFFTQYFHGTEQFREKVISSGEAYYFDGITYNGFDLTKMCIDMYLKGSGNSGSRGIRSIYEHNIGASYTDIDIYFKKIISGEEATPPGINTTRLLIWQN